jgi:hypothetical protein
VERTGPFAPNDAPRAGDDLAVGELSNGAGTMAERLTAISDNKVGRGGRRPSLQTIDFPGVAAADADDVEQAAFARSERTDLQ